MPKKFNEVLKTMVEQSGVSVSDDTIKKILDNPAFASIEVDDVVSTRLTEPRFTLDSAKANPDLKKHFTALALNGVDAEVSKTILELELGDEAKTEIEGQDTTFKKVSALAKKVKDLESKKVGAGSKDKTKLETEIEKLNTEIKTTKDNFVAERTKLLGDFENERINFEINTFLSSFNYALPKETPQETVIDFGRSIVNKAFQEKGVKLSKKDNAIVLQTPEGTDYFENNVKIGYKDFIQKSLANAKVLSASAKGEPGKKEVPANGGKNENQPNYSGDFSSVLDEAIADVNK